MVTVDLETGTLAVLVSGLYCADHGVDAKAIPSSIWISIAEKLEYFLPMWDYDRISFEDWIKNCLLIYPKEMFAEDELEQLQGQSLYWEFPNGRTILFISMDISVINNV